MNLVALHRCLSVLLCAMLMLYAPTLGLCFEGARSEADKPKTIRKIKGVTGFRLFSTSRHKKSQKANHHVREFQQRKKIAGKDPHRELGEILRREEFRIRKKNEQSRSWVDAIGNWLRGLWKRWVNFWKRPKKPKEPPKQGKSEGWLDRWLKGLWEWCAPFFRGLQKLLHAPIFWGVLGGLVVLFLLYAARDHLLSKSSAQEPHSEIEDPGELDIDLRELDLAGLWKSVDEYAARGEFREAIRYLYWASLLELHHKGALTLEPNVTNWELLKQLPRDAAFLRDLRLLVLHVERVWYGMYGCGEEDLKQCRDFASSVLATHAPSGGVVS